MSTVEGIGQGELGTQLMLDGIGVEIRKQPSIVGAREGGDDSTP